MENNQIARQMGTSHFLRKLSMVTKSKFLGKGVIANRYLGGDDLTVAKDVWYALLGYLRYVSFTYLHNK